MRPEEDRMRMLYGEPVFPGYYAQASGNFQEELDKLINFVRRPMPDTDDTTRNEYRNTELALKVRVLQLFDLLITQLQQAGTIPETIEPDKKSEEEIQRERIKWYSKLVDKRFIDGLSDEEEREMNLLGAQIDKHYNPFYERIEQLLEEKLNDRR